MGAGASARDTMLLGHALHFTGDMAMTLAKLSHYRLFHTMSWMSAKANRHKAIFI